jgi:site-specific DNA recombinase
MYMNPQGDPQMKAVIFTRVSSAGQEDGVSLDAQEAKLKEYCQDKSLPIIQGYRVVESSTVGERKKFKEALNFIEKQKEPIALVVHSIDRLLRGFKEYGILQTLVDNGKMEIHAYNERLILCKDSPLAVRLQFDMMVLGAKMYVGMARDHIIKARDYKLGQGEIIGHVPTGYLNYRDTGTKKATVILDNQRAILVKRLFQEYSTGTLTYSELVTMAKQWGLTSHRTNEPLSKASMAKMIKNPFYKGQMLIKGKLYSHVYPILIEPSLFDQCQAVSQRFSKKNKTENAIQQRSKKPFVFRGLIRCSHCGCQITSDIKKGRYVYLFCSKAKGKELCKAERIREEKAMEIVENVLDRIKVPESLIQAIQERLKTQYDLERADFKALSKQLQSRLNENEKSSDKLLNLYLAGSITEDTYDKKQHQLQKERQDISNQLATCFEDDDEFRDSFVTLLRVVSHAADLFKSSKVEQKRKIISFVFSNLFLEGENIRYELNRPFDKLLGMGACKSWWSIGDSNS